MIELVWFGCCLTLVYGDGLADILLPCTLVEAGGMGHSTLLSRTPATLVLRDVAVGPEESLEAITPFVPPSTPDPDNILIEAKVSSPRIPNADLLLHADCNEQEVVCELSHYFTHESPEGSDPTYFMVSLSVEGVEFSTTLLLQTLAVKKNESTLIHNKLGLPLSQSGTLLTEVIFLVFSHKKSVSAPLRSDVVLTCGFKQQETPLSQEVEIEWRMQHRGKGQRVLEMKTSLAGAEGSLAVNVERDGSTVNASRVVSEGDASVTLSNLKVPDEGTYICTVTLGLFHGQQAIRLHVAQPPHVSLSEEKLVFKSKSPQTLSCHSARYYPLDAQMEWLFLSPSDSEPSVFPDQGSLSSHRQHSDGTYSLSSRLSVPSSISPGTKITCRVSHLALDAPLSVSLVVESPQPDSYWWVLGFLIITLLFFVQVMK
ncbi:tapasin-related protein [Brachionichthys hirsutus]|uniref:tapasin-related protein n=1 Tax=Brachionichthys hirsutus TaxID=412623 RepID=UPI003604CBE8